MDSVAEPLIPAAVPPDRDLNSSPSPPPSPLKLTHTTSPAGKTPWIPIAAASGACAAFNGVFAKLTTTQLTSSWASAISTTIGLSANNKFIEFVIRALFFSLNLAFNALMWALFTAALTRASSTTRVSIINTSANFMLTAFSGWIVFGESLPGLWWVGAAGLVVGNVIIGRREEEGDAGVKVGREGEAGNELDEGPRGEEYRDSEEEEEEEERNGGVSDRADEGPQR